MGPGGNAASRRGADERVHAGSAAQRGAAAAAAGCRRAAGVRGGHGGEVRGHEPLRQPVQQPGVAPRRRLGIRARSRRARDHQRRERPRRHASRHVRDERRSARVQRGAHDLLGSPGILPARRGCGWRHSQLGEHDGHDGPRDGGYAGAAGAAGGAQFFRRHDPGADAANRRRHGHRRVQPVRRRARRGCARGGQGCRRRRPRSQAIQG
mmetsp:Transcript_3268/g.8741  ORF Transcript_3268/g.8741 Transcript_3268/m.8741 type:complete len:209 (+) Transcript_3268:389-1015(+)